MDGADNAGCERAAQGDTWTYRLLKEAEIALKLDSAGDVEVHSYWRSKFKRPHQRRAWLRELSGRLLSRACSIIQNGQRVAAEFTARNPEKPPQRFCGALIAAVAAIEDGGLFEVWHEPIEEDLAVETTRIIDKS